MHTALCQCVCWALTVWNSCLNGGLPALTEGTGRLLSRLSMQSLRCRLYLHVVWSVCIRCSWAWVIEKWLKQSRFCLACGLNIWWGDWGADLFRGRVNLGWHLPAHCRVCGIIYNHLICMPYTMAWQCYVALCRRLASNWLPFLHMGNEYCKCWKVCLLLRVSITL